MISGLASAATAIFTGVPALADLTNMAGQAIISGYGREAELEADRLGASYLAKAGYDPEAMIHVIATLKDQDTFERERARLEGREPRLYHGVFASHPDNDTRLQQAVAIGRATPSPRRPATLHNAEGFLQAIEGLPVGSSARQGMVRDNRFYHSRHAVHAGLPAGLAGREPAGQDPRRSRRSKEHVHGDPRAGAARGRHRPARIRDARAREPAPRPHARRFDINGLKAWTGVVRGDPSPFGQSATCATSSSTTAT